MIAETRARLEEGRALDVRLWRQTTPMLVASTATFGGGLGPRDWVLNAEVAHDYQRTDTEAHMTELASYLGLVGDGVGMLTAARVSNYQQANDGGVYVEVTTGLSHPTWAAAPSESDLAASSPGTINIVAFLPVRLSEAALLNAIATATEAKTQALWEASIAATGTPTDAVCIACPLIGEPALFGGPRSLWGAPLARAVHQAVLAGALAGTE